MHVLDLEIAGILFSLSSDQPIVFRAHESAYLPFLEISGGEKIAVPVRVVNKNLPDAAGLSMIFQAGEMWEISSDGNEYRIIQRATESSAPSWAVHFSRRSPEVTVFSANPEGEAATVNPLSYPVDQLLLIHLLAGKSGALLHAAGVDFKGRGYLFPGRSGAGKSTISGYFAAKGHEMLSDDRMIARNINGEFRVFGTPWPGDANMALNRNLPLEGIYFLRQSSQNKVKELSPSQAAEKLMPVTSIPFYDKEMLFKTLSTIEDLVLTVPAYELHFSLDNKVVEYFDDALTYL